MKLASWNVNGVRSAFDKGLSLFIDNELCDFILLQEIKATPDQMDYFIKNPAGYKSFFNPAHKKGYAGTGIYYKKDPKNISTTIGFNRFDAEGRFIRFDYDDFVLINLYIPHGGRDKSDLAYKLGVYDCLLDYIKKLECKNIVIAGDFNIAHTELDLSRPKENENNIMFTPTERQILGKFIELGYTDSFRFLNPQTRQYSWFSYAFDARKNNIGWRLDYFFVKGVLKDSLVSCYSQPQTPGSDHCPVILSFLG